MKTNYKIFLAILFELIILIGIVIIGFKINKKEINIVNKNIELNAENFETEQINNTLKEHEIGSYNLKKDATIVLKYIDRNTNEEISEEVIKKGRILEEYDISEQQKEISGYVIVEKPESTGRYTKEREEKVYTYARESKVIVNHIDKNTGTKLEVSEYIGKEGDKYTSSPKDIENYAIIEVPEQETVTMTKEPVTINYYYDKILTGAIEKHIDITTNELLETTLYEGSEGAEYNTVSKEFEGYSLVESMLPQNANGQLGVEVIEIKYYYIRKISVKVEYINNITKQQIENSTEIIRGIEGDSYKTEEKNFNEYKLISKTDNITGEMKAIQNEQGKINDEILVQYYYVKKSGGVKEQHIDNETGALLKEIVYTGYEGEKFNTNPKFFEGYVLLNKEIPTEIEGIMKEKDIIIKYYYKKLDQIKGEVANIDSEDTDNSMVDTGDILVITSIVVVIILILINTYEFSREHREKIKKKIQEKGYRKLVRRRIKR